MQLPPSLFITLSLLHLHFHSSFGALHAHFEVPTKCNEQCRSVHVPFPFHLNATCGLLHPDAFRLSCSNSTSRLALSLGSKSYPIIDFSYDSLLLDLHGVSSCRRYSDISSLSISGNPYFGLSADNLLRLYDCVDSSVCKVDCEQFDFEACEGNDSFRSSCCYSLSDQSVWRFGNSFSEFAEFGCRGFSSWVVAPGTYWAKRGLKVEWAVPRNYSEDICAGNALFVNATAVRGGGRCVCGSGYVGDGFAEGTGCFQSCIKNGDIAYGKDCDTERRGKKKVVVLAGILTCAVVLSVLVICYTLLRHPLRATSCDLAHLQSTVAFLKACKIRLFTYRELEEATKGFAEGQKISEGTYGSVHAGVLEDGSLVAVQKIHCDREHDLKCVLTRVETLHSISHKNIARLLGCCTDSNFILLVVYEFFANSTLDEYLLREGGKFLDWCQRMNIAIDIANALAYLQFDISPPIYHHDLNSSDIYLEHDYLVKVGGFWRFKPGFDDSFSSDNVYNGSNQGTSKRDVCSFGMILMEMVTGSKHVEFTALAFSKIRDGRLEEIVDPSLCYRDYQSQREQIERVGNLSARCLSLGGDGRLTMVGVAIELMQIMKENVERRRRKGAALEETFSTSSLLQMISMSPDSLYAPSMGADKH